MLNKSIMVAERCHSKFMKNVINKFFFFFHSHFFVKYMYFSTNVSTKIKFILKWKIMWPETAKVCFFLKTNFDFVFELFITKLKWMLVLNLSSSWPKTAIVNVYNICNGVTEIIRHARILQYKTRNETLSNYEIWIKKLKVLWHIQSMNVFDFEMHCTAA